MFRKMRKKSYRPPNSIPYGFINQFIKPFLKGATDPQELDTEALGIHNVDMFYNSCYQAAKRSGVCKAHKNGAIITLERVV